MSHRWLLASIVFTGNLGAGPKGAPPQDLMPSPSYTPVVAPDGTVEQYFTVGGPIYPDMTSPYGKQSVMRIRSRDHGRTWSKPEFVLSLPKTGRWFNNSPHALYDRSAQLHIFLLDVKPKGLAFWHAKRSPESDHWSPIQYVGPSGPQNNPIQLRSGRIIVPIGYERSDSGVRWDDPAGIFENTTYYSDDEGTSWRRSPARLTVPVPTDHPSSPHYGGYEPVIMEIKDGRVWMLIRNQTGHFYESFSKDGVAWSLPRPTQFSSSDSPGSLVRLRHGEIVLFWNNCLEPLAREGAWVYAGRDALHAALSPDEGKTWLGYREVYLDPLRNQSHLAGMGDRGTAYPAAAVMPDGNIALISGQGTNRRRFIVVDPNWLRETHREDDFSTV